MSHFALSAVSTVSILFSLSAFSAGLTKEELIQRFNIPNSADALNVSVNTTCRSLNNNTSFRYAIVNLDNVLTSCSDKTFAFDKTVNPIWPQETNGAYLDPNSDLSIYYGANYFVQKNNIVFVVSCYEAMEIVSTKGGIKVIEIRKHPTGRTFHFVDEIECNKY